MSSGRIITNISKADAEKVINVIANNTECVRRIKSGLSIVSSILSSGGVRNLGFMIQGVWANEEQEEKMFEKVCTGIADATSVALNAAVRSRSLLFLESADSISRVAPFISWLDFHGPYGIMDRFNANYNKVHHTATLLRLRTGAKVVFDWHYTLDPENPLIYNSDSDFTGDTPARTKYGLL